jgi:ABC-type multidrug transport system fused ATPase/permease subunit
MLDIPPGSHVAIIGKSGCGKTTLSSLLIGLYEPASGQILIDGQLLSRCSLKSIRQSIGVVQQEVLLFDGTVRENLLLGNPRGTETEVWSALTRAGIAPFIRGLPGGLDTLFGKGGVELSGGQKQRLSIARIYLKNPAILIFDEATSALDQETEAQIHDAWRDLLDGRTAIVISHRLSSVLLCDSAVLLENGKIAASGKPEELLERNMRFRELFAVEEVQEFA